MGFLSFLRSGLESSSTAERVAFAGTTTLGARFCFGALHYRQDRECVTGRIVSTVSTKSAAATTTDVSHLLNVTDRHINTVPALKTPLNYSCG